MSGTIENFHIEDDTKVRVLKTVKSEAEIEYDKEISAETKRLLSKKNFSLIPFAKEKGIKFIEDSVYAKKRSELKYYDKLFDEAICYLSEVPRGKIQEAEALWEYCGGNHNEHALKLLEESGTVRIIEHGGARGRAHIKKLEQIYLNETKQQCFVHMKFLGVSCKRKYTLEKECICGKKPLKYNCYIRLKKSGNIIIIGSSCIARFKEGKFTTANKLRLKCKFCDTRSQNPVKGEIIELLCAKHKQQRDSLSCPRRIPEGRKLFKKGKHKGKTFYSVTKTNKDYCDWARRQYLNDKENGSIGNSENGLISGGKKS